MTYDEAIKYLTPNPTSEIIQFQGDQLREALDAIKQYKEVVEAQIEDLESELEDRF